MRIKCDDSYISEVTAYIGEDRWKSFYLYADLLEYKTQGSDFGLWIFQEDQKIQAVAYRYYDTVHLYSQIDEVNGEIAALINELVPKCITGSEQMINRIKPLLKGTYKQETNHIITLDHRLEEKRRFSFVQAFEKDVPEIAAAMMKEEVYSHVYTYERLCQQLEEGIRSGKRRHFMIKDKTGNLLAAAGTYVETADAVVLGGLITSSKAKGFGFGPAMSTYLTNMVIDEGKQMIGFIDIENEDSIAMHRELGFSFVGKNSRLVFIDMN